MSAPRFFNEKVVPVLATTVFSCMKTAYALVNETSSTAIGTGSADDSGQKPLWPFIVTLVGIVGFGLYGIYRCHRSEQGSYASMNDENTPPASPFIRKK